MRAAICDDNETMLKHLLERISGAMARNAVKCEFQTFTSGNSFLKAHRINLFDIVFLDIKMPETDGFEVARQIRRLSEKTYIIFITTENALVYDSLDFRPFNFIPKDSAEIMEIKLNSVIKKLAAHISANMPICFSLPHGEKKYVHAEDILYVSSKSNYVDINCKNEVIHLRSKLESLLEQLPEMYFARIHNRYIINLSHLCRIDNTRFYVLLDSGIELDISRAYKPLLTEKYNLYLRNNS